MENSIGVPKPLRLFTSSIPSGNAYKVELLLSQLGIHYRLKNRDLPGSPDIANRTERWAVFVHGCYWHRHPGCRASTTPTRNKHFWMDKFRANVARDRRAHRALVDEGFRVVVVWECETKRGLDALSRRLAARLLDSRDSRTPGRRGAGCRPVRSIVRKACDSAARGPTDRAHPSEPVRAGATVSVVVALAGRRSARTSARVCPAWRR